MFGKPLLLALGLATLLAAAPLHAAEGTTAIPDIPFSFDGPFGTYDPQQLQRGLQVYTEVCSACHGLDLVAIRTLADKNGPNWPERQVKAFAETFPVSDPASNPQLIDPKTGEPRKLTVNDTFPANNTMNAPDLSLMAKARAAFHGPWKLGINQFLYGTGGPQYIVALLNGYGDKTRDLAGTTVYQNHVFPGGWIRMPPPLSNGQVSFADGAPNDAKHMSEDVAAFLMWTAEPKMTARKHAGFDGVILLLVLSGLLFLTNRRLWAGVK
ncbi:cytochrome c1, partial [Thioclava sp. BHET1]